ncbi:MAG: signal peptidase II [Armatimonadetes bacterium]|nr:signal peptidase II [Armatimonadota bacterium]MBI2200348.1 signal peptidase II [Armatimonadota bacterium]MBI2247333.1 signal peptidase II [Armatimonadota bacterium]MBI2973313.1 signal peptidase II [Armatimonadota bacterium]
MRNPSAAILGAVVLADQTIKVVIDRAIPVGTSHPLLPPILFLTNVRNPGIAFSALPGIPLIVPALIVLTLIFLLFSDRARWAQRRSAQWGLALLTGGAFGNLIDRARVGAVIDYLDLQIWPVFNLADAAITVGAALLILTFAWRPHPAGTGGNR